MQFSFKYYYLTILILNNWSNNYWFQFIMVMSDEITLYLFWDVSYKNLIHLQLIKIMCNYTASVLLLLQKTHYSSHTFEIYAIRIGY